MTVFSLADADWLARHRTAADLIIVDVRPASDYWAGHLAGARHLDAGVLAIPSTDAAAVARFQALLVQLLSGLGIVARSRVLVVGAAGEVNISRVAWALGYAGVQQVLLLDGGLAGLPAPALVHEAPAVTATRFALRPMSAWLASAEQVQQLGAGALVDARERVEFLGERSNARRNGRIPGARHWDTRQEVDVAGRFRPLAELVQGFAVLATPDQRLVAYCGGGGRAARTFIALQLAGHQDTAVYPASWSEWGNRDDLPVESGEPAATAA
ncbi:rhodanese-like domain-containing protein [Variovorax sp. EBFNA2]|uniref:sulfurtransferase n=1 Tax=Variovorax sp. EBFNA2 TaxID=3342097 RepID=UPI0029C02308|nr:rhodanese-like domain-containing protein [Variovorax boronicumulans]WPG41136.1 rhodanese-like domain-containing protein [Variovorax boronicumulans]